MNTPLHIQVSMETNAHMDAVGCCCCETRGPSHAGVRPTLLRVGYHLLQPAGLTEHIGHSGASCKSRIMKKDVLGEHQITNTPRSAPSPCPPGISASGVTSGAAFNMINGAQLYIWNVLNGLPSAYW